MLTALIIGITPDVVEHVSDMCGQSTDICVYKTLESYPNLHEVARLVNTYAPDVAFLQVWAPPESGVGPERVRKVVEEIRMARPETALIALLPNPEESGVRMAAELSIPEILVLPYMRQELDAAIFHALDRAAGVVKGNVYSFLPSKSGNGATVTALNVAASLARDFKRRTLLLEADIGSGSIAVMLNIQPDESVLDALESSDQLTDASWSRMVVPVNGLDILASKGGNDIVSTSRFSYFHLLSFAQQHYDEIIVDFPGVVDEAADPLLLHSRAIYVVCTPELTSLALVRRRLYNLEQRGILDSSRVILNRYDQSGIPREQIEETIGHKISAQLPNDYKALQKAVESASFVDPDSKLGKAFTEFAATLVGLDPPQSAPASRLKSLLRKLGSATVHEVTR